MTYFQGNWTKTFFSFSDLEYSFVDFNFHKTPNACLALSSSIIKSSLQFLHTVYLFNNDWRTDEDMMTNEEVVSGNILCLAHAFVRVLFRFIFMIRIVSWTDQTLKVFIII